MEAIAPTQTVRPVNGLIDLGWGRRHLRILGSQTLVIVVLTLALAFHMYLAWRQNEYIFKLLDTHTNQMTTVAQQHTEQSKVSERTTEELIYLLAAPQNERELLYRYLRVPERFRNHVRRER